MANSSSTSNRRKAAKKTPNKPYKDFPLGANGSGYWAKRILGKIHYFGRWGRIRNGKMERLPGDGWKDALDKYNEQKDDLYAGRKPRPKDAEGLTLKDLCNKFLTRKQQKLDNDEIVPRTFYGYKQITDRLITVFGGTRLVDDLDADDFAKLRSVIAKSYGPVRLGGEIQQTRMVFKFGYDEGLIEKVVRYGQSFDKPSKKVLRKHRSGNGEKMFEAEDIRKMLDAASPQLRAMILLGVNCGFGNSDCGTLPLSAVNLEKGWIKYPRPKTGIDRRCPLWSETIEALKKVIEARPQPKNEADAELVFVTKYGQGWTKETSTNPISAEMRKLLQSIKIYRAGIGFYALRHVFETIGGESRDQVAVNHIMGHAQDDMASVYRERISDERLRDVTDHVHAWLFPVDETEGDSDE